MSKLLKSLVVGTLGLSLALASPALGRGGGGGGGHGGFGGGMHGGFGGGMHGGFGGGMHAMGGGMHFGGMGGPRFAHAAFAPGMGVGFRGMHGFQRNAFHHRFFHDRFRNRFAFFGAPFLYAGYYDGCWQRVWTPYGWSWTNSCYLY